MSDANGETLGEKRNVSMALRLVVERDGRLVEGEVLDHRGRPSGHFVEWEVMTTMVKRLASAGSDNL